MSQTAVYHTTVSWPGERRGHVVMGNGPAMPFAAPPDAGGPPGVLTPEDAFVAALNTCVMLMFLWACERYKLDLRGYDCRAEGRKEIALDRTEIFSEVLLRPHIRVAVGGEPTETVRARVHKALQSAQKYSLVANSIRSELRVVPEVELIDERIALASERAVCGAS
ncbi:MAG: OsmC family protein [Candidatus Promineofilum sp.]|jgi:organic hydroperoxide reductase OsmC/OhrA|nr:OsmC family protein [Promineifilum sp.]